MQNYQVLTQNDIERIHETSLRILEEVGVVFVSQRSRDVFAKGGAKIDGQKVHLPRALVEQAIKSAPSSFKIHGRNPARTVEMNTEDSLYVGPNCPAFITDLDRGRRNSTFEDYINLTKLIYMLDNVDMHSQIPCEPCDLPEHVRHLHMAYQVLKCSDKPFMGSSMGYEYSKQNIEMAAIAHGGMDAIRDKCVILSIPCSLTPLAYDENMSGAIHAYAEYGQPQVINSLCVAGATSPCTLAGTIAVQNAEILAGLTLAQLIRPGTPCIYSGASSNMDMRSSGLCIGSPEASLFAIANSQMAKYYQIPCRIGGSLTSSKYPDAQAAYESMMNLLSATVAHGNFILHAVGILEDFNCVSYEKLIIDNEMIGMVKRIRRGIEVNDDTLAFDVIEEVGPQGEFLTTDHTFDFFRQEFFFPKVSDRTTPEEWESKGSLTAAQRANGIWKQMLADYEEPSLPADVDADLQKYMESKM